jgi:outer membrane protein TolC
MIVGALQLRRPLAALALSVLGIAGCARFDGSRPALDQALDQAKQTMAEAAAGDLMPSLVPRQPAGDQPLRVADCIEIAVANNRGLARSRLALERAVYGRDIAEVEVLLPSLSASYGVTDDNDTGDGRVDLVYKGPAGIEVTPFIAFTRDNASATPETTTTGITVSRPLLARHEHARQRLPVTTADKDIVVAAQRLVLAARQLALQVTQSVFAVQRAQVKVAVREARVRAAEEFLAVTRSRVENGFAAPVDIVNATINLNQAEADLLAEKTRQQNARDRLVDVMGLELDVELQLAPFDGAAADVGDRQLARDRVRLQADHEELVNQRLEINLAAINLAVQADEVRPDLAVELTAEHRRAGDGFFAGRDEANDDYRVELTYTTTLDFKKAARARLAQLERQQEERRLTLRDKEIELERRLREAHRNIAEQQRRITLAETRFEAEKDKLTATLARYDRGNVDNLEVTRAQQARDDAEIRLLEARIDLILAQASYDALLPPVR